MIRRRVQVLKDLYPRLIRLNLRMVIVLTKVDLVDPTIDDNVANTAYSHDVHQLRVCVAKHTGVPLNQVRLQLQPQPSKSLSKSLSMLVCAHK